jgi:tetratricopeptide (TPR) repeat protein
MKRRRKLLLLFALGGIALVALALWRWHVHSRTETLLASLPPRPALSEFPRELAQRVEAREQSLRRGNVDVAALADLATLYHANGFLPEALQCYRGLARLDPQNPRWPHRLACLYADFGRLEDALALWARAADHLPARIRTGDALVKLNRHPEAATAYAAALKLDSANPHALTGLARIDMAAHRWAQARDRLEQAARASDGRIGADLLATTCDQLGDTARASAIRARAKSSGAFHDPPDSWIDEIFDDCYDVERLTVAAGFADHAGNSATARRMIDRAVALAPNHAPALYQSGTLALAQRDYDKARSAFEACVRAAPTFSDGWVRLVALHLLLGNAAAADRALAAGLIHCPNSPALLTEHAGRLAAAGRDAEALKAFTAALSLRPNDADTLVKLAPLYFRLERIDDGLAALHRALAVEPEHPAALTTLTLHGIGTGDEAAAREWLTRSRLQERVPRPLLDELVAEFRKRFGRAPW